MADNDQLNLNQNENQNELRDSFHFAKLAQTNIRFLNDIQNSNSGDVASLVEHRTREDNVVNGSFLFLHQAAFLQFAYICLVWLWERAKTSEIGKVLGGVLLDPIIRDAVVHGKSAKPKDVMRVGTQCNQPCSGNGG